MNEHWNVNNNVVFLMTYNESPAPCRVVELEQVTGGWRQLEARSLPSLKPPSLTNKDDHRPTIASPLVYQLHKVV